MPRLIEIAKASESEVEDIYKTISKLNKFLKIDYKSSLQKSITGGLLQNLELTVITYLEIETIKR